MIGIVGGGLGGLAAAAVLAANGRAVTVYEGAPELGGKAGEQVVDGVAFDTGPSVVTLPDVLRATFADAHSSLEDHLTLRPVQRCRLRFDDATIEHGHGPDAFVEGVAAGLGDRAAGEAADFLAYSRRIWEAVADPFVLGPAPSVGGLLGRGPRALVDLFRADPLSTMQGAIDRRVTDPRLRAVFSRFATYNGSDPRRAPATLNCITWVELGLGAYGLQGGLRALVDALVRVGEQHGVRFRTGARVASLQADRDGIRGLRLVDGTQEPLEAVVCNADARHLADALLPDAVQVATTDSTSGWTGVLRVPRQERPAHEVLFHLPYADEFRDLFDRRRAPVEPTVYVCAQEPAHGRTGWAEEEALFVMLNAPAGCDDVSLARARALERLEQVGIHGQLVWERDPSGLARRFPGSRGSLYGAASNSRTAAFQRPPNRTHIPGLYLASGSAHPGGGVPMVLQSGRTAARQLLEDR